MTFSETSVCSVDCSHVVEVMLSSAVSFYDVLPIGKVLKFQPQAI